MTTSTNSNLSHGFTGYGRIRLALYDLVPANRRFLKVGNAQAMELQPQIQMERIPNMRTTAGGDFDTESRVDQVTVSLKLDQYTPQNLAFATNGRVHSAAGAAVVAEAAVAHLGGYVPFASLADVSQPITVKDSTGTTTFVAGSDYVADAGGITIPVSSTITDLEAIKFSYQSVSVDTVEGLVNPNATVSLIMTGVNRMAGGTPGRLIVPKLKLSVDSAIALITQKPGQLSLKGTVLLDDSIAVDPANPVSQFFTWQSA